MIIKGDLDILVISTACVTSINRRIYEMFSSNYNLLLVIPKRLKIGSKFKIAEKNVSQSLNIITLDFVFQNPRIQYIRGILNIIRINNPKVVIIENEPASFIVFLIGVYCNFFLNVKIYCISYENFPLGFFKSIERSGFKSILQIFLKRTFIFFNKYLIQGVFTVNNEGTSIHIEEGYKNVNKIPLGFDSRIFNINNNEREFIRQNLDLEYLTFGYFGRITEEKGIHILINALAGLLDYNWELVIDEFKDYENPYIKKLKNLLITSNILDRVKFVNPLHIDISKYMNAVDCVVIPSISTPKWVEQYGRVASESLACGKLVVVSNSGSLPMVLNNNGIVFNENDEIDLRSKLKDILIQPDFFINEINSNKATIYAQSYLSIDNQFIMMKNLIFKNI